MVSSASIPAVRQNRSKLTETASQALPTAPIPVGGEAIDVVLTFFMALLSFVDSTPRAYRLKASNAAPPISTFAGAIPSRSRRSLTLKMIWRLHEGLGIPAESLIKVGQEQAA